MKVYEQITFFIQSRNFSKNVFDRKIHFSIEKINFAIKKTQKNPENGPKTLKKLEKYEMLSSAAPGWRPI